MDLHRSKDMDLFQQVHSFGLTNIHTFGPIITLIRLFSAMLNFAKSLLSALTKSKGFVLVIPHITVMITNNLIFPSGANPTLM